MRCEGGREAMNYPQRHSLAPIVRVLDSGTKPVHLIADDTQEYVAKHNRGREPCTWLRNELLAHAYARIWDLPTLEGALMRVDPGHVGGQASTFCQPAYFKHTSFATRYRRDSTEFNQFLDQLTYHESKRFHNRQDLLKIALFDIWLANEDRTPGNPNLLVTADEQGHTIRVMDHEHIFNSNGIERPLSLLTLEDSILTHPALRTLLGKEFNKDTGMATNLVADLVPLAQACEQRTDEILSYLPADWQVDVATFTPLVRRRLFAGEWLRDVGQHFHELLSRC